MSGLLCLRLSNRETQIDAFDAHPDVQEARAGETISYGGGDWRELFPNAETVLSSALRIQCFDALFRLTRFR